MSVFCFVTSYFNLTFFISSVKRFRLIVQTILISNIFTHLDKLVDNNGGRLQRIHYFLNIIYFSYLSLNPNSKLHSVYQRTHLLNHLIAFRRLCPKQQFRTTKFLVKIHRTMVRERKFNKKFLQKKLVKVMGRVRAYRFYYPRSIAYSIEKTEKLSIKS